MPSAPDVRTLFEETCIAVESALALAGIVAQHAIVESSTFNQMVVLMNDAADALATIKHVQGFENRIFATKHAAKAALAAMPTPEGLKFRIAEDGIGRATVRLVVVNKA